jgi:hypothetical protein
MTAGNGTNGEGSFDFLALNLLVRSVLYPTGFDFPDRDHAGQKEQ